MRRFATLIVLVCLLAGAAALWSQSAAAAGAPSPITDCNAHDQLTRHYSTAQLRNALNAMPADIKEYTDCYDVIQRQLVAQIGGLKGDSTGSGGGGSFLPTPVIVVIAVVLVAAAGFGVAALRRRGRGDVPAAAGGSPPAES